MTRTVTHRSNGFNESAELGELPKVSATAIETYLRCREEYRIAWVDGVTVKKRAFDLRFGIASHAGVARWWSTGSLESAVEAFNADESLGLDVYDRVKGEVMLAGYHARWAGPQEEIKTVHVEKPFSVLRAGPPAYKLVGKMDAVGRNSWRTFVCEHKTTSQDLTSGSPYWSKLAIDTQVSLYQIAARSMRIDPDVMMYDVIKKPDLEPFKATPEAKRKYTKKGALYANLHEADESPADYRSRLIERVSARPEDFYARAEIVRLEHEHERATEDLDTIARDMARVKPGQHQPKTVGSCVRYGRTCDYFDVCCGTESLDSDRFVQIRRAA